MNGLPFNVRHSKKSGFSLIELLVAITVLGLMMLGLAQLMNSTAVTTAVGLKHMDADSQAQMVLDRIAFDVSRMVKRTDVDYYFPAGNKQMAFFSEASGYYPVTSSIPKSNVALVGYRINASYQMERLSKGLIWNGVTTSTSGASSLPAGSSPMVFLPQTIIGTWNSPGLTATGSNSDSDYQVIGDQIFRLQLCYLVQNSSQVAELSDTPNLDGITSGNIGYFNPQEVLAIIVSIAVLDTKSQKMVSSSAMATAAADLVSVTGTAPATPLASLPATVWKNNLASNQLGLPLVAAQQVRFYQRYCYLNHLLQ